MSENSYMERENFHTCRTYAFFIPSRASHHRSLGGERRGKRKRSTIFLERARGGIRQSDEHCGWFKPSVNL